MARKNNDTTVKTDLFKISPNDIVVIQGFNARQNFDIDDLAENIAKEGVLNPISVVPFIDDNGVEKYRLVDGERRYRAVMKAISDGVKIERVPAIFLSKSLDDKDLLKQQLLRNEGVPFNEYEMGVWLRSYISVTGMTTQEALADLGLAPWKGIFLTHLERDKNVQELMKSGKIEGITVRKIYTAHKGDEKAAVAEIMEAAKSIGKEDDNGKIIKKVTMNTLNQLNSNSKTIERRDTDKIYGGLKMLFTYLRRYKDQGVEDAIDICEIYEELGKQGASKNIVTVIENAIKEYDELREAE